VGSPVGIETAAGVYTIDEETMTSKWGGEPGGD